MQRWMMALLASFTLFGVAHAQEAGTDTTSVGETKVGRRIALVIGISSYSKLPAELALDTPRTEAARVAAALEQGAGFDQVRLLTDASASMANVEDVIRSQVSKEVQWRDLFLLYFVGHGVGGDFGDPRFLFYDTDPDSVEATSLTVRDLATLLQKYVPASRYVVITDAAHTGTLGGMSMLGPTGNDWPTLGNQAFILSSAAPRQFVQPGVFSKAFVEAVSGQADTNGDGIVSGSELNNYLVVAVPNATAGLQLPTVQSNYSPSMEITGKPKGRSIAAAAPKVERVDKAKFVFQSSTDARVQCGGMTAAVVCDPSCNLWDLTTGPCTVSLRSEGTELTGTVNLAFRGAYTCGPYQSSVQCSSPPPPQ